MPQKLLLSRSYLLSPTVKSLAAEAPSYLFCALLSTVSTILGSLAFCFFEWLCVHTVSQLRPTGVAGVCVEMGLEPTLAEELS